MAIVAMIAGRVSNSKFEIYFVRLSQSQNDETARRQTTKRRNSIETVVLSTGASFRDCSDPQTVIFSFLTGVSPPSRQERAFFYVK